MTPIPLFHIPLPPLVAAEFRAARAIADACGGWFINRLTRWSAKGELNAGWLFATQEAAERAASEIAALAVPGAGERVRQMMFLD